MIKGRKLKQGRKKLLNLLFLSLFLSITLFVNFFHTEKTVKDNPFCPACHFQSSSFTTNTVNFFIPTQLFFLGNLKVFEYFNYRTFFCLDFSPRGPPQA